MAKFRIITSLIYNGKTVVKGHCFQNSRSVNTLSTAVSLANSRQIDELIIFNTSNLPIKNLFLASELKSLTEQLSIPLSIGGGISNCFEAEYLFQHGVEKVIMSGSNINSIESLITELSNEFGSQAVSSTIDIIFFERNRVLVKSKNGQLKYHLIDLVKKLRDLGVGEVILQSVERDGKMNGLVTAELEFLLGSTQIPLILSGGASDIEDFYKAANLGFAGVSCGAAFQFSYLTPKLVKDGLRLRNVPVRII